MPPDDLKTIEERAQENLRLADGATPGPWLHVDADRVPDGDPLRSGNVRALVLWRVMANINISDYRDVPNGAIATADFIAAAREGWPEAERSRLALVQRVRELEAVVQLRNSEFELRAEMFRRDTGMMAPGKDDARGVHSVEERQLAWKRWREDRDLMP